MDVGVDVCFPLRPSSLQALHDFVSGHVAVGGTSMTCPLARIVWGFFTDGGEPGVKALPLVMPWWEPSGLTHSGRLLVEWNER